MAQTGFTPIQIYSSSTAAAAPVAGNLTNSTLGSELAINITDGKLFYKDNANAVQVIGWKTVPTTAGGTGLTSYTAGDLLYYASGTTLSKLAIGAANTVLTSSGTAPQWSTSLTGLTSVSSASITNTSLTSNRVVYSTTGGLQTDSANLIFDGTNLGIGTTPTVRLQVGGDNNTEIRVETTASNTAGDANLLLIGGRNTDAQLGRVRFYNNTTGTNVELARVQSSRDGANDAANLQFYTRPTGGSVTLRATIQSDGLTVLSSGLSISSTSVTSPVSTDGNVFSGTYTPSLTNVTNVAASTATICQYMRVGNVITVSGQVSVDPTATGNTEFRMSLPVASNFASTRQVGGTFFGQDTGSTQTGVILASSTNDQFIFRYVANDTANRILQFHVTYLVI